jgi:hypothetical protein
MRVADFRCWLEQQRYSRKSIANQCSQIERVRDCYGDLDEHFNADRLETILSKLKYSAEDRRKNRRNSTRLKICGNIYNTLVTYRASINLYRRFREEGYRMAKTTS